MPSQVRQLLLGLDIGSSRIKALLLDDRGHDAGGARVGTPFGWGGAATELSVADLVGAVAETLSRVGPPRRRVVAVGITGMAESGSPLDTQGRSLAPVIAWHDPRGAEVADRLVDHFGADLAMHIGRSVRPVSSVAKLGWLVDHGVVGTAGWLGVPELCLDALTGSRATEFSLAACSGCWDVTDRTWLGEVAEVAGFDAAVLPRVLPAGRVMGRVSAAAASWSGLEPGTAVTLAGHDHLVAAVGAGAAPGDLV
ncbi:MAG: FGGY family carbohydrate kinase, partial [Acidimicrobiales bacterium]